MTQDELQELINNFDIDEYCTRNNLKKESLLSLVYTLKLYQKQDYLSILKSLNVENFEHKGLHENNEIYYMIGYHDKLEIIKYYCDCDNERLIFDYDDLEGIKEGVEYLRSKKC